jgi:hypothetical protein
MFALSFYRCCCVRVDGLPLLPPRRLSLFLLPSVFQTFALSAYKSCIFFVVLSSAMSSVPNRRASHIGVLRTNSQSADNGEINHGEMANPKKISATRRRQSMSAAFVSRDFENVVQSTAPSPPIQVDLTTATATTSTPILGSSSSSAVRRPQNPTPSSMNKKHHHHRTKLGAASSYYFKDLPQTPLQKQASARKKLHASLQKVQNDTSVSMVDESFTLLDDDKDGTGGTGGGGGGGDYNGTLQAMETSYLSSTSGSSNSSGGDLLNTSVLSDTTELTASNFVLAASARQRWSLGGTKLPPPPRDMVMGALEPSMDKPPAVVGNTRRKTLPPGMTAPIPTATTAPVAVSQPSLPQRESRQGSVVGDTGGLVENALKITAEMKERRLARQSLGGHLSIDASVVSKNDASQLMALPASPEGTAISFMANSSVQSKSVVTSPLRNSTTNASDDESVASLGSLFDGVLSGEKTKSDNTASDVTDFTVRPSLANELLAEVEATPGKMTKTPEKTSIDESVPSGTTVTNASARVATELDVEQTEETSISTQEAVGFSSQTSQLGTPIEASTTNTTTKSPRPLPESVAFEASTEEGFPGPPNMEMASPFQKKSPRRLSTLERKLSKSPIRLNDSPARNTRSSKRLSLSAEKPTSAEKKRKLIDNVELADDESFAKRGRKSSIASVNLNSSFRKASSRHSGSARKVAFGSPDVVEFHVTSPSMSLTPMPKCSAKDHFGIPDDTQEIEADMNALLENVNNPEAVARLSAVDTSTSTAGSTPYASRRTSDIEFEDATRDLETNLEDVLDAAEDTSKAETREMEANLDDVLKEVDDSAKPEITRELEMNLEEVLNVVDDKSGSTLEANIDEKEDDDASDMSDDSLAGNLVGEQTQALEIGMDQLLAKNAGNDSRIGSQSTLGSMNDDEDNTVELEADMGALLMAASTPEKKDNVSMRIVMAEDDTPLAGRRRSSIASRRFSLATKSRLSLDVLDSQEDVAAMDIEEIKETEPQETVLNMKVGDVMSLVAQHVSSSVVSDIFTETTAFVENNPSSLVAETLCTFLREICAHVASGDIPAVDPEYFALLDEPDQKIVVQLQQCLRSDNKEPTEHKLVQLMEFAIQEERLSLEKWLLDTAIQAEEFLSGHIDELSSEREKVIQEIQRINDAEYFLSSLRERAARKARRKSLERRKVGWSMSN